MAKVLTKSQIIQTIADAHKDKLARKDVARLLESLTTVGHKELKKNGIFVLPGFAKFVVVKKPATKERQGINPFTKEPITIKAKPARKVLKARPVKAAKDSLASRSLRPDARFARFVRGTSPPHGLPLVRSRAGSAEPSLPGERARRFARSASR